MGRKTSDCYPEAKSSVQSRCWSLVRGEQAIIPTKGAKYKVNLVGRVVKSEPIHFPVEGLAITIGSVAGRDGHRGIARGTKGAADDAGAAVERQARRQIRRAVGQRRRGHIVRQIELRPLIFSKANRAASSYLFSYLFRCVLLSFLSFPSYLFIVSLFFSHQSP